MKYFVLFYFLISTQFIHASDRNDEILFSKSDPGNLLDRDANERYHDQFIDFKTTQNNLPDIKRNKSLFSNQYWLVNKKQDLWIGVFDGKYVKIPAGTYVNIPGETLFPESIIRIKRGGKISQFLLLNSNCTYPSVCVNRRDGILFDAHDYMVFYTGCARDDRLASKKLSVFYNILFYSKTFDTILRLDEFPDSAKHLLKKLKITISIIVSSRHLSLQVQIRLSLLMKKLENLRRRFRKQMIMEILS